MSLVPFRRPTAAANAAAAAPALTTASAASAASAALFALPGLRFPSPSASPSADGLPPLRLGAAPSSRLLSPLTLQSLDDALPDGGLPRGAIVEVSSPRGLARSTSIALAACASAQAAAAHRGAALTAGAWCAWIDPAATLYAPGVAEAGVDLGRLLVVRPPEDALSRTTVRVAESRAFAVIVADVCGLPGDARAPERLDRWAVVARRLAIAIEGTEATVLLLTDKSAPRSMPLPVAMRLELERPAEDRLTLRVAKDRRGRVGAPRSIPLGSPSAPASRPSAIAPKLAKAAEPGLHLVASGG
jgi:recombination protein RecA